MLRFAMASTLIICTTVSAVAQETSKAYAITLKADDVHEISNLSIEANGLKLTAKEVLAVPIRCEREITGAMLIGNGEFHFTPPEGNEVTGVFRAAMLRFDPADQPKLLPLDTATVVTDRAAHEMSNHLLNNVFRHCWHSGMKALIPDSGSLVANVYSKAHGDLLISTDPKSSVVHNFTDSKTLYTSNPVK